jgi:hypothetical protein
MLALLPAEQLLRLDFEAEWLQPPLFEVQAAGGGEFHFNKPWDWRIWLGKDPSEGLPVTARVIDLGSNWLLTADYWFGLDASRGTNIGARASFGLRAGIGSVYAEIVGSANANLDLSWKPSQLDGSFGLQARARLAAGPIVISFTQSSTTSVVLDSPRKIEIPLRACIELNLGITSIELCLHYTFAWRDNNKPHLDSPIQGLQLVPRYWSAPFNDPGDDGIRGHRSDDLYSHDQLDRVVAPHSELVLEFSKGMAVGLSQNTPVELHNDGKPSPDSIGKESGWWQSWVLEELELIDVTDGRLTKLFGTFSRSPLDRKDDKGKDIVARPPNTELRLLSSRRFGQDGSLGGGGAEQTPPIECKPCCGLARLVTGPGRLPNGWAYEWHDGGYRHEDRDNRFGVGLAPEDNFIIYPPADIEMVDVTFSDYRPGKDPVSGGTKVRNFPGPYPQGLRLSNHKLLAMRLCWTRAAGQEEGAPSEEWTVPPAERVLIPDHEYTLRVVAKGTMFDYHGVVGRSEQTHRIYHFKADHAPYWEGALTRAIAAVYPDDGRRPVYRDYDLVVRFKDDVFHILYPLDNRQLGVRLRDANGALVQGPDGDVLLPIAWNNGPVERSPIETWWQKARHTNAGDGCEGSHDPIPEGKTVLPIYLQQLKLAPCTRYNAELVAVDLRSRANVTEPLARWSFTTSRFHTFSELVAPPPRVAEFGLIQTRSTASSDFDELIRAFDAPVVAIPEAMRVVPVRADDTLAHLLIEAPEPLDDALGRLCVFIDDQPTSLTYNIDRTRVVATLQTPTNLVDELATIAVRFEWVAVSIIAAVEDRRTIVGKDCVAVPIITAVEDRRTIEGKGTTETSTWNVPLKGVF